MNEFFERRVSARSLAVLRILVGPIAIVHLYPFFVEVDEGRYFTDVFFMPFFEGWPVVDASTYRVLVLGALVSSVTLSLGLFTRLSAIYTLGFVAFNVLSNQLFFHNNRAFLISILFCLAVTRCGATLSLDALWAARRSRPNETTPLWSLVMARGLVCIPYLASGTSKLFDPDWFGGVVMYDRLLRYRHVAEARGVPAELIDLVATPGFHAVFWKIVVISEIFIGIGYWFGRTRVLAMLCALGFHTIIEITSQVSVFSYLGICATLFWVVPRVRDRKVWIPAERTFLRWLVGTFDWLARFDVREGPALVVVDRDGTRYEGREARRLLLSRLPPLMPIFAPWFEWTRFRRTRTL